MNNFDDSHCHNPIGTDFDVETAKGLLRHSMGFRCTNSFRKFADRSNCSSSSQKIMSYTVFFFSKNEIVELISDS